jgi:hypothetical protein
VFKTDSKSRRSFVRNKGKCGKRCIPLNRLTRLTAYLSVCLLFLPACSEAGGQFANQPFENREYGFKATIPNGLPTCLSRSGTRIHGIGTVINATDCENRERAPVFSLWADYNALFMRNALEMLRANTECPQDSVQWASGEWNNAIDGLRTAICRNDLPDGQIVVLLAAQAGKWGEGFGENANDAKFNYTLYFISSKTRFDSDVALFKTFVKSIGIFDPRSRQP